MNVKFSKITKTLLGISIVAVFFNIAYSGFSFRGGIIYLVWNLFLAWVPYIISSNFIKKEISLRKIIPIFLVWMIFFPNAPYLVTDIIHTVSSHPNVLWFESLLFFFYGWVGLLLAMLSLSHIHSYLKKHFSKIKSEISIFIICLISSFGIYLGRYERWNSWDLFLNPLGLMKHSLNISTSITHTFTPYLFIFVFSIFLYSIYKTISVLMFLDQN